jgi:hypothetical protein
MEKYAVQNIIWQLRFPDSKFTNMLIYINFLPY